MRRAVLVALGVLCAAAAAARAADVSSPAFLPLSGGARAFALSGASIALVDDADATFLNPARLAFLRGTSVTVGYGRLVEGLPSDRGGLAVAIPLGDSIAAPFQKEGAHRYTLGVALDYQRLELAHGSNYGEATATLAAAVAPANIVAFGAALRGLRTNSEVDGLSAGGYALDLGFSMAIAPFLEAAVAARNVAGRATYEGRAGEKPGRSMNYALAFTRWRWAAAEADYRAEYGGAASLAAGVELKPLPELTLRGGLRRWLKPDRRTVPSAGAGVRYGSYFIDYSVQMEGDESLGLVHRVSLGTRP